MLFVRLGGLAPARPIIIIIAAIITINYIKYSDRVNYTKFYTLRKEASYKNLYLQLLITNLNNAYNVMYVLLYSKTQHSNNIPFSKK